MVVPRARESEIHSARGARLARLIATLNAVEKPNCRRAIDMTSGNLGLTDQEANQIIAFLETLSDGLARPYPNIDTFTGACMTGGSASTQGNESLIPAPPRVNQQGVGVRRGKIRLSETDTDPNRRTENFGGVISPWC
jgi:hypothetical protein